jgi:hypothetical protein
MSFNTKCQVYELRRQFIIEVVPIEPTNDIIIEWEKHGSEEPLTENQESIIHQCIFRVLANKETIRICMKSECQDRSSCAFSVLHYTAG